MQWKSGWGSWRRGRKIAAVAALVVVPLVASAAVMGHGSNWRTASRASTGIAPDPATTPEAVAQVYVARAYGWRGALGVHSWIAVKPTDAPAFTVYEVIGWHLYHGDGDVVRSSQRPADGMWFGNAPEIIADLRGEGVDDIIRRIEAAVADYPYPGSYTVWPGPNSNTFTAHVARAVPELAVDLPPTAIGKDYLPNGDILARTPSGTGWQVSLFGVVGVMLAADEGFEINLFGLVFGIDIAQPALKLPGFGRIALVAGESA